MTYRIRGLAPGQFEQFFAMDDSELTERLATRQVAGVIGRYPCRVSLEDAEPGDELVLLQFTNHDVATPYRNSFAIYVRESAKEAAEFIDEMPPILRGRPISLRCYDATGMLLSAAIALQDDVDAVARGLLKNPQIAYIDAHNAMHGCFAARIERYEGGCDE